MKFRIGILLLCCLPGLVQASDGGGGRNKEKCKEKVKCNGNRTTPTVEELVFVLPSPEKNKDCSEKKAFRSSVIDFYKWYLQHEDQISAGLAKDSRAKDMVPPFNISWQTLHDYFQYIQKNSSSWIDEIGGDPLESNAGINYNATERAPNGQQPGGTPTLDFSNTVN